jgi:drug/metabolite transporter (DMT)-like permease
MYFYIIGASFLKMLSPYLRKYMLTTLDPHDLLYINSMLFFMIVALIFLYQFFIGHNDAIRITMKNYGKLSWQQVACMFLIAAFAVSSTFFVYELDKYYNTPFINYIMLIGLTLFSSFIVGIYWFEEQYSKQQMVGIALTIMGIYLMVTNREVV